MWPFKVDAANMTAAQWAIYAHSLRPVEITEPELTDDDIIDMLNNSIK